MENFTKTINKYKYSAVKLGCGLLILLTLCSGLGLGVTWFKGTIGRAGNLLANEEAVRIKCQDYREGLEQSYKEAQNVYTQEIVLTVQDLANVATLSNEQKIKVNDSALRLIFGGPTAAITTAPGTTPKPTLPPTQGIQGFVGDLARTGIQFDKTDDELYRQVSRAIRDGRFKFTRKLEEFTLKEKLFKDYINQTRVKIAGNNQVLNMSTFKGCYNSVGDTQTYNNADEYFAKFVMPTTQATENAFSKDGFDAPVLNTPTK